MARDRVAGLKPANLETRSAGHGRSYRAAVDDLESDYSASKRQRRTTLWGDRKTLTTPWGGPIAKSRVLVDLEFSEPTRLTVYGTGENHDVTIDEGRPVTSHWFKVEWSIGNVRHVEYWDAADLIRPMCCDSVRVTAEYRDLGVAAGGCPISQVDELAAWAVEGIAPSGRATKTYWLDTSVGALDQGNVEGFIPPFATRMRFITTDMGAGVWFASSYPDAYIHLTQSPAGGAAFDVGVFYDSTPPLTNAWYGGVDIPLGCRSFMWSHTVAPWTGANDWCAFMFEARF